MTEGVSRTFDEMSWVRQHARRTRNRIVVVRRHTKHRHVAHAFPAGQYPVTNPEMVIRALIAQFYSTCEVNDTEAINDGFCQDFATRLNELLPGAEVIDGQWGETDIGLPYEHVFVKYLNRYYDAEAPQGVSDPAELPFFDRVFDRNWSRGMDDYIDTRRIAPTKAFAERIRAETHTLIPTVQMLEPEA